MLEIQPTDLVESALDATEWYATQALATGWRDPASIPLGHLWVIEGRRQERSSVLAALARSMASTRRDASTAAPRSLFIASQDWSPDVVLRLAGLSATQSLRELQDPQTDEQRATRRALGDRLHDLELQVLGAGDFWGREGKAFLARGTPMDLLMIDDVDYAPVVVTEVLGEPSPQGPQGLPGALRQFARRRMCCVVVGLWTFDDQVEVWEEAADRIIRLDHHPGDVDLPWRSS